MKEYIEFLERKRVTHTVSGFDAKIKSDNLFEFQNHIVNKALHSGKYAIFSGTGTGKTRMQLMVADAVVKHTNKPALILAPLAVSGQTKQEAGIIGVSLDNITIINYEQLDNIDTSVFGCIILDEASILKNHEGSYRNQIIQTFKQTPYKFVFTATPSPNDPMEIGNYSEFLDIMPRNEMLAMYFVHDGGETSKWRIKGHAESVFWEWVSTWAIMFQSPGDIGFEQDGYDLPQLNLFEKIVETPKRDNGQLFNSHAVSATNFNAELRVTKDARLSIVAGIVNNSTGTFLIWIKQNEEGETLRKLIPGSIEVAGSDTNEYKEQKLLGFARGEFRVLITKGKIAGMGLNFQVCHNQIFASPDFSFEMVFQGIRRSWRFGQKSEVNIYIIVTDTMTNVIQSMKRKQAQFDEMQKRMTEAVNKNVIKKLKMERESKSVKTENYEVHLGDCIQLIQNVPDESIGFSIFSPPFASLYTYSDQLEDMGNSKDYNEFLTAFNYLTKELFRVLWSGRNVAVHCMDLPIQKGKEGYIGLRDFSGMILKAFEDAGFIYHSRVTIWKNPVTEMQRTKALGLLHKQVKKDASMSRVGIPDYLLVFRKPGEHLNPVRGEISVDTWQKYASPVWMDIDYGDTLNERQGREDNDERHICPLQLPTIERAMHLWTNKGDTILTPFMGIGSEVYKAVLMGRKGIGFELKASYFNEAVKNIKEAILETKQLSLI